MNIRMKAGVLKTLGKNNIFKHAVFFILLLATSYYYNYHEILTSRPVSKHQWRNCVSASMALNYHHEGSFFHPRTHNMQADEFTSDITVTEFPIIYYFVGWLYGIFGYHEIIYRVVQVLIGFAGLYFLFRLGLRLFRNTVYALSLPLLIFSSPIYVYYLNNFMPDTPSFSLVFIAFYLFYRFYEDGRNRDFILSMLFFALAGLIKTPAFLMFFAICGVFLLEKIFGIKSGKEGESLFKRWPLQLSLMAGVLLLSVVWYAYAKIYTDLHGGNVSAVAIRPIWRLSAETIQATWTVVKLHFWSGRYHSPVLLLLAALLFLFNLISWKRHNLLISWLSLLSFLGAIAFSLLFFRSMKDHDYYQINNLITPLLIIIGFLLYLKQNFKSIFNSWITQSVLAVLILFSIFSCHKLMSEHYYGGWFEKNSLQVYNNKYGEITPYLRSLGIEREDKVYCTPDPSINISLYLMDQKGHTDFHPGKLPFSEKVELFSRYGLKYVIIGDYSHLDIQPEKLGLDSIGGYNGAGIYRVPEQIE